MSKTLSLHGFAGIELRDAIIAGMASVHELEALGADPKEVWAAKSEGNAVHYRGGAKASTPTAGTERTRTYVFSDERVDRHGDIIMAKGWDVDAFAAVSGPILWGHNHSAPPIGKSSKPKLETIEGFRAITGNVTFAEAEVNPDADLIWRLIDAGFLKTGSVGFKPIEAKDGDELDDKMRTKLGLGRYGVLFLACELLEFSIVSVPANPGAREIQRGLKMLTEKGFAKDSDIDRLIKTYPLTVAQARSRVKEQVRSFALLGDDLMANLRAMHDAEEAKAAAEKAEADALAAAQAAETETAETEIDQKETDQKERAADTTAPLVESLAQLVNSQAKIADTLAGLMDAVTLNLEAAAETAKANRQLADAVYDLAQRPSDPVGEKGTRGAVSTKTDDESDDDQASLALALEKLKAATVVLSGAPKPQDS